MAAKTTKTKAPRLSEDEAIVREARDRFKRCQDWEATFRPRYIEDTKFYYADSDNGWAWPDGIRSAREGDSRPMLTVNKARQYCLDIMNDMRQSKPSIKVNPIGDEATYDGAQVMGGIVRHIESRSVAQSVYDAGGKTQVIGGRGYWRVLTDYVDQESFDQEALIKPIPDPLTVYLDPDIKQTDGSDANFGFVFDENTSREEFDIQHPDFKDKVGQSALSPMDDWVDADHIRICEYYRRRPEKAWLLSFTDAQSGQPVVMKSTELPKEILAPLLKDETTKRREIIDMQVEWFKIAGDQIIERGTWVGSTIPIVRVIGEESIVERIMDCRGHMRALKDPARMYNYWSPLSLDTPLPTPSGWTTMGQVKVGDMLLSERGEPCPVQGMSPVHVHRDCYQINFDDGSNIVADGEHKWKVEERGRRKNPTFEWTEKVITTAELQARRHYIYATSPLALPDIDLPIHPYLLGVWLGDGTSVEPVITAGDADIEHMRSNLASIGCDVGPVRRWSGSSGSGVFTVHGVRAEFAKMKLLGNKHIPGIYLRSSKQQREYLLQGLMDTDGCIGASGQCDFTNTNPNLISGVTELLRSLGIKVVSIKRKGRMSKFPGGRMLQCADFEQLCFTPHRDDNVFMMERKRVIQKSLNSVRRRTKRHGIVSIERVASVPVRCVSVPGEMFLAGTSMIPTHNSSAVEFVALQSKTPYVGAAEAIEGYETYWKDANTSNSSMLPFNAYDENGNKLERPQREQPPQMADAYLKGMQVAQDEMRMVTGQYQDKMQQSNSQIAFKTQNARMQQGDNATFHFADNLAAAVAYTGRILVEIIPKIYDTKRILKIMGEDGTETEVTIDPNADAETQKTKQQVQIEGQAEATEKVQIIFNPGFARYSVVAEVGPAYATRRQEAFNAFTQIIAASPDLMKVAGDLMFRAADFPMAEELAQRLKRLVPPEALGKGPSPEVQQLTQTNQQQMTTIQTMMSQYAELKLQKTGAQETKVVDEYRAETDRMKVLFEKFNPQEIASLSAQLVIEALGSQLGMQPPATTNGAGAPAGV